VGPEDLLEVTFFGGITLGANITNNAKFGGVTIIASVTLGGNITNTTKFGNVTLKQSGGGA
jgi:hypothetical protein